MELLRVTTLSVVVLCCFVEIVPGYFHPPNNHPVILNEQPIRLVAIISSRPIVLKTMIIRSKKNIEELDRMFFLAGVDRFDYVSCLGMKAMFAGTKEKSVRMGQPERTKVAVIKEMAQTLRVPRLRVAGSMENFFKNIGSELPDLSTNDDNCDNLVSVDCDSTSRYRTADGSCNNLRKPVWGRAFIPMRRFVKPAYQDGVSEPKTFSVVTSPDGQTRFPLPSARMVSRVVHESNRESSLDSVTHMVMQWGQFLDHDITSTPENLGTEGSVPTCCIDDVSDSSKSKINLDPALRDICFPIEIPPGDAFFRRSCLSFVRSVQVSNADCRSVPVEQLNQITAYIDGSQIYGSSLKEQSVLRTFRGGLLKTSANNLLPKDDKPSCVLTRQNDYCFKAGDKRVNEQMALASMHTIWMREHNRIAKELAKYNPDLDDETLFQESRKIVGALLQHITYSEFLPIVLGPQVMKRYGLLLSKDFSHDYNPQIDPSIRNAFATAAYRFGHSMIQTMMSQYDRNYNRLEAFQLKQSFGNTSHILRNDGDGVNFYIRGLLMDKIRRVDRYLTKQVTDHLFEDAEGNSLDLAALNIQRGRDHGLPGYNEFRKWCGLRPVTSFSAMNDHPAEARNKFRSVYRHVDDIDLFSGGVSETRVQGGLVGPTFSCLLANQFRALKQGDRFWFNRDLGNLGFRPDQLKQIRKQRLSRVICDNTDTVSIQRLAFRKVSQRNPRISCEDPAIPKLDLSNWMNGPARDSYGPWSEWSQCVGGRRSRTRQCLYGGSCRGGSEQTERCRAVGSWGPWTPWSSCNYGIQSRTRSCLSGSCKGIRTNRRRCTDSSSNGGWGQWGEWSACVNEVQIRRRQCLGGQCPGESVQRWYCSGGAGTGRWSEWGQWTSCLNKVQIRERTCLSGNCEGKAIQKWKCSGDPFGGWADWSQWSSCINGVQSRRRKCIGTTCKGDSIQRWKCTTGNWGEWGPWSACTNQVQERSRTCIGTSCPGIRVQRWKCSSETGNWGPWFNWSTCVNGNEYRARRCESGSCNGNRSESRKCLSERSRVTVYCRSSVYQKLASKFCPD